MPTNITKMRAENVNCVRSDIKLGNCHNNTCVPFSFLIWVCVARGFFSLSRFFLDSIGAFSIHSPLTFFLFFFFSFSVFSEEKQW